MVRKLPKPSIENFPIAVLVAVIAMGTLVSRLFLQASDFDSFDAINYSLAISHFDMRLSQPQPPGYILYILIGRMFNLFFANPRLALEFVSAFSSGFAVIAMFLLAKEFFGRRAGLIAACFLATSTLFWYAGEISAPYTTDILFAILISCLCYQVFQRGENHSIWLASVVLGLAGAFRLQTMVFFFPLFLYSIGLRKVKTWLFASTLAMLIFSSFFVPSVLASGGFSAFPGLMTSILPIFTSVDVLIRSTFLARFQYNAGVLVKSTFTTVGELLWPFVAIGLWAVWKREPSWKNEIFRFLGLMVVPIWIVYFLIWAGNQGTFLVTLPAFILLAARGMDWLIERLRWKGAGVLVVGAIVMAQSLVFLILPVSPFGDVYRDFPNHSAVVRSVEYYQTKLALVQNHSAADTLVIATDFRFLQVYLPQYHVIFNPLRNKKNPSQMSSVGFLENGQIDFKHNLTASDLIPTGTRTLIFFDTPPEKYLVDRFLASEEKLDGNSIMVVQVPENKSLTWTSNGIELRP